MSDELAPGPGHPSWLRARRGALLALLALLALQVVLLFLLASGCSSA